MSAESFAYRGFLSYAKEDSALARAVQRRLEAMLLPRAVSAGRMQKLGRFYSREGDPAALAHPDELPGALAQSEWLIVCCSPSIAQADRVNDEINAFIAARSRNFVLAVILDVAEWSGEPWESYPRALRVGEPLAADLRASADGIEAGLMKLASVISGVEPGRFADAKARGERRIKIAALAGAGLLALTTLGAGVAGLTQAQASRTAQAREAAAVEAGADLALGAAEAMVAAGAPKTESAEFLVSARERVEQLYAGAAGSGQGRRAQARARFAELFGKVGDYVRQGEAAAAAIDLYERLPQAERRSVGYARALAAAGEAAAAQGHAAEAAALMDRAAQTARAVLRAEGPPVDPPAQVWLAGSLRRVGEMHVQAGRPAQGLPLFAESAPTLQAVVEQSPQDSAANANFVAALLGWGAAALATGDEEEAKAAYIRAVAAARGWTERTPNVDAQVALADALANVGQIQADGGHSEDARGPLEESLALTRTLAAQRPDDAAVQGALAERLMATATVLVDLRRAATPMMEEAAAMGRGLVAREPDNLALKAMLAKVLSVQARRSDDPRDGARLWAEVVSLRRALFDADIASAPARDNLIRALRSRGDLAAAQNDRAGAQRAYGQIVSVRRRLVGAAPEDVGAQKARAASLQELGQVRKSSQAPRGAARAFGEAAEIRLRIAEENETDRGAAFAGADSLHQLAVVQADYDPAAARASLEREHEVLSSLAAARPGDRRYADALRRNEEMLRVGLEAYR
jgi:tetratricopeptide (TPR) repeat protein